MHKNVPYRPDIDGLRALAVSAVVLFHAGLTPLSGGFVGVDIFFVISGYLITLIILKDCQAERFSMIKFWERRVRRIIPALLAVILFCLSVGWFLFMPDDLKNLGQQVLAQAAFSSNILFYLDAGYFDAASDTKPLLHTWSLAVEEQFYLFFPLIFFLVWRFARKYLVPLLTLCFLASLGLSIYGADHHPSITFYMLPTRAWELLIGALIIFLPPVRLSSAFWRSALSFIALLALMAPFFFYTEKTTFPGLTALLPCGATAFLIWLNQHNDTIVKKLLSLRPVVFVGLISYSWYLWHWPLIVFAKYYFYKGASPIIITSVVITSFLIAIISWRFIEHPLRARTTFLNIPKHNAPKEIKDTSTYKYKPAIIWGVLILYLVVTSTTGGALHLTQGAPERLSPQVRTYAAGTTDINPRRDECHYPEIDDLRKDGPCLVNKEAPTPPLFLSFGDSFSTTLHPALEQLSQLYDLTGATSSYSSCPPVLGLSRKEYVKDQTHYDCAAFNNLMLDFIKDNDIKHVILFARWSAYMDEYRTSPAEKTTNDTDTDFRILFRENFIKTLQTLQKTGVTTWIVEQPPEYDIYLPSALAKAERTGHPLKSPGDAFVTHTLRQKEISEIFDLIKNDSATFPNVHFIDPTTLLCPDKKQCRVEYDGYPLYRDKYHLSRHGSAFIEPLLDNIFVEMSKTGAAP